VAVIHFGHEKNEYANAPNEEIIQDKNQSQKPTHHISESGFVADVDNMLQTFPDHLIVLTNLHWCHPACMG